MKFNLSCPITNFLMPPCYVEFAKTPESTVAVNTKMDGGKPNDGLLKKFQDMMLKQRPERVSHLLQENLPKCEAQSCLT